MSRHEVTLIEGDGIGPEIVEATRIVIAAADVDIEWDSVPAGEGAIAEHGTPLPDSVLESIRRTGVALKGPLTTPVGTGFRSVNVALRRELDLYINLRPARSIPYTFDRYDDVDIVVVRENTEDLYAGIEYDLGSAEAAELLQWIVEHGGGAVRPDSGISIKPISVTGSERIVRAAFDYAVDNGRSKVTAVNKANIMKATDGLFLEVARKVAAEYDGIEFEDRIVDATSMALVIDPTQFDVLVMPNLYGDIVSDISAGLIGGLGLAPSANIGTDAAIFEAVHGSAPTIAGQGIANPTALLLSAVEMLRHLGEKEAAAAVSSAVIGTIADGKTITADLRAIRDGGAGAAATTNEFALAVADRIAAG